MEEETKKLRSLRKERERELTNRHTKELQDFDVVQDTASSSGPWKHRVSGQRSAQETNNGSAVNGRKSSGSSPTGSTAR